MYDGKRGVALKLYMMQQKKLNKSKDEPINIFNEAINNIKPTESKIQKWVVRLIKFLLRSKVKSTSTSYKMVS